MSIAKVDESSTCRAARAVHPYKASLSQKRRAEDRESREATQRHGGERPLFSNVVYCVGSSLLCPIVGHGIAASNILHRCTKPSAQDVTDERTISSDDIGRHATAFCGGPQLPPPMARSGRGATSLACMCRKLGEMHGLLAWHGATQADVYPGITTHVIAGQRGDVDPQSASILGIHMVTTAWVFESVKSGRRLDERQFRVHRPLAGVVYAITGVDSPRDASRIKSCMATLGATLINHVDRKRCTHLIAAKAAGPKYEQAMRYSSIKIVSPRWVDAVSQHGAGVAAADEIEFAVTSSPQQDVALVVHRERHVLGANRETAILEPAYKYLASVCAAVVAGVGKARTSVNDVCRRLCCAGAKVLLPPDDVLVAGSGNESTSRRQAASYAAWATRVHATHVVVVAPAQEEGSQLARAATLLEDLRYESFRLRDAAGKVGQFEHEQTTGVAVVGEPWLRACERKRTLLAAGAVGEALGGLPLPNAEDSVVRLAFAGFGSTDEGCIRDEDGGKLVWLAVVAGATVQDRVVLAGDRIEFKEGGTCTGAGSLTTHLVVSKKLWCRDPPDIRLLKALESDHVRIVGKSWLEKSVMTWGWISEIDGQVDPN